MKRLNCCCQIYDEPHRPAKYLIHMKYTEHFINYSKKAKHGDEKNIDNHSTSTQQIAFAMHCEM